MIIERIISGIRELGLTGYEIERLTPLSQVGVDKILNGTTTNPRKTTLNILYNLLLSRGVSKSWLDGESEQFNVDKPRSYGVSEAKGNSLTPEIIEMICVAMEDNFQELMRNKRFHIIFENRAVHWSRDFFKERLNNN